MRGLYAIIDIGTLSLRRIEPLPYARALLAAHPAALQLRAKNLPPREVLTLLRVLGPLCRAANVMLVANDRADLAALAGCDCVHVGQDDIPVDLVRRIAPTLRVGVSTHNLEQLKRALDARPAYVAYGPIFPTQSKVSPDPCVGIAGLKEAAALAATTRTPLVAIGGITHERVREVAAHAHAAAVILALLPDATPASESIDAASRMAFFAEVTARARVLHAALGGDKAEDEARA